MNSNLEIGNSFCSNSQPGKQKRYHTSHTDIYLSTNKNSCGHIYIYIFFFLFFGPPKPAPLFQYDKIYQQYQKQYSSC
ncbi:hypothetical protein FKM82_022170 [Ascaphus truei]